MKTNYAGIDYARFSQVNRDKETGIRYGIIPAHDVGQAWYDAGEPQYPECENPECQEQGFCDCQFDTPLGITYNEDGYSLNEDDSGDLWVFKSPYFTYAQFCSPCAPGACYLLNPLEEPCESNRCFCLHHEWFENDVAPYPVYSVATGKLIKAEKKNVPCPNCGATGRDSVARIAQVRGCKVSDIDVAQLHVTGYKDDGTFDCWRCNGKGALEEMIYTEK